MTRVVLDTDVVIDFLRGRGDGMVGVRDALRSGRALVTAITVFELRQGTRTSTDHAAVELFCRSRTLALTLAAAMRAGQVGADLRAAGTPIGPADTLIAGICLHHDASLLTRNRRHFEQVPGLQLGA